MKLSLKIIVALIAGLIAMLALVYFEFFSESYFSKRQHISEQINTIETAEKALDYQVLSSGFFLFLNQDEIIAKINTVEKAIDILQNNKYFVQEHATILPILSTYRKAFENKTAAIYDFQTANSAIKNATMALIALKKEAILIFDTSKTEERLFLESFTVMASSVLLAKNSLDADMIGYLEQGIKTLLHHHFTDVTKEKINLSLIANLTVFKDFFPQYKESVEQLDNAPTKEAIALLRESFLKDDLTELNFVKYFSYFLIVLYISSLGLIIYFLIRSEKEVRTDKLSGLGNRKAYEARIRMAIPSALFLVDINKFKNYNDFYGITSGDKILKMAAHQLKQLCQSWDNALLYRLGGNEFGIVIEHKKGIDFEAIGLNLLKAFHDKPIVINGIETSLSITVAVSTSVPLLETADIALKSIKKDRVKDFVMYHEGLNLFQVIQDNITKTHELHYAFKNDRLIPHFQPIVSLISGEIEKYEALARLVMQDGEIRSIVDYLGVVKESKYYPTLTRMMVQKSFEAMKDLPHKFSINLSSDDITDYETVAMIETILERNPQIAQRVIFEILESEAMNDYQKVVDFIQMVKGYGCQIAIDDFGSGYSNFLHILSLDIDIIKIDGSLIRHLDTSSHAVLIVETIVGFAKKAGKKIVAEFVYNEAIHDIVKELGIECAQGYYTGKPEALS